jgi:5'-3' exonuclease
MMGDAADNIPDLPVWENYQKFLKEYGSMETLLTDKLKGKMKENIEANKGGTIKSTACSGLFQRN